MGTRLMLNLRENFYNPGGGLPGADGAITSLTEMRFGSGGSRQSIGGRMQEFVSRDSEDCQMGLDSASVDHGATIESGADIPLDDLDT